MSTQNGIFCTDGSYVNRRNTVEPMRKNAAAFGTRYLRNVLYGSSVTGKVERQREYPCSPSTVGMCENPRSSS
jgi:hypothetical protein